MTLHYRWLNDVSSMVSKISRNFKSLFSELKCAGDVSLHVPEREVKKAQPHFLSFDHLICNAGFFYCVFLKKEEKKNQQKMLPGRLLSVRHQDPRQVSRCRTSSRAICTETQWWREICFNRRLHDGSTRDDVVPLSMRRRNQSGIILSVQKHHVRCKNVIDLISSLVTQALINYAGNGSEQ